MPYNTFTCKETEKLYRRLYSKKIPHDIQRRAMKKLWMIDASTDIKASRLPPSNQLEKLMGDRKGKYSIRINDQWRICFRWESGNAFQVEIVDYH
ncbi:type II toxin-antitoxin system RelE/ParE family toxin [candidate division KSB1 bacterium]|nr:type II toxin-antitoxin system RelE/ParE family toxin [candidate division KSB1 bacterium]